MNVKQLGINATTSNDRKPTFRAGRQVWIITEANLSNARLLKTPTHTKWQRLVPVVQTGIYSRKGGGPESKLRVKSENFFWADKQCVPEGGGSEKTRQFHTQTILNLCLQLPHIRGELLNIHETSISASNVLSGRGGGCCSSSPAYASDLNKKIVMRLE